MKPIVVIGALASIMMSSLATGCATTAGTEGDKKTLATPTTTSAPTTTEPADPVYPEPAKADFELTVKTLSKECFGSAGCNITFRVKLAYGGPALDPSKTYELTYEIRGGEDPMINTMEVTGDSYTASQEESISTNSSRAKLRAVVSDISEA